MTYRANLHVNNTTSSIARSIVYVDEMVPHVLYKGNKSVENAVEALLAERLLEQAYGDKIHTDVKTKEANVLTALELARPDCKHEARFVAKSYNDRISDAVAEIQGGRLR